MTLAAKARASESTTAKERAPRREPAKSKTGGLPCHSASATASGAIDPTATIVQIPRKRANLRRRAAQRLAELYRLAVLRREHRFHIDPGRWAFVLAATLACGKAGVMPLPGRQRAIRWHGLDLISFREAIQRCDVGHFDDDELATIMAAVERWQAEHGPQLITPSVLGAMLQLTSAGRQVCRILTIDAVDEPKAERKARVAVGRRERDRQTKRAKRGRRPREVYEAGSVERAKPWEAVGVSRRTWYRRKVDGTGVSAHDISSVRAPTQLCHGEEPSPRRRSRRPSGERPVDVAAPASPLAAPGAEPGITSRAGVGFAHKTPLRGGAADEGAGIDTAAREAKREAARRGYAGRRRRRLASQRPERAVR